MALKQIPPQTDQNNYHLGSETARGLRFRSLRRVQESHPTRQFCRIDKDTMHSSFIREKVGWSLSSHYTSNSSVFSSRFHLVHCNRHREVGVAGSPMIAAFDASCSTFKCHCPQPDRNTNCNVDIKTRQQFAGCGLCCTLLHTAEHCCTLLHTTVHCCILLHTATHCCILLHTAVHCCILLHTAVHACTLLYTAAHYCTLQSTAVHCCILLHTAAHCFTQLHTAS